MNRNLPSKGCDPTRYNKAKNQLKAAKAHRKRVEGDRTQEIFADLLVAYARAELTMGKPGYAFNRGGYISGGRKEEWVLRA
jgi:hypothetical protein